jgi:NleD-like pathogen effector protein (putative zinc metallopeptidase)
VRQSVVRGIAAILLLALPLAAPGFGQEEPKLPEIPTIGEFPETPLPLAPASAELPPMPPPSGGAPAAEEIPAAPAAEEIPAAPAADEAPEQAETEYGHNIRIEGTPEFVAQSVALLDSLAELPTGKRILEELGETGKATVVRYTPDMNAYAGPLNRAEVAESALGPDGKPGAGVDAQVRWNPEFKMESFTPEIVMGHELIHALHAHLGERNLTREDEGPNAGTRLEELRTIGTNGFEDETLTENALRREWNELHPDRRIPEERTGHGANDFAPEKGQDDPGKGPAAQAPAGSPSGGDFHRGHLNQPACAGCSHKGLSDILKQQFGGQK